MIGLNYIESLQKTYDSFEKILKNFNRANFASDEAFLMANIELAKLAMQGALNIEELELKQREMAISEEKLRQELELNILNAKSANRLAQAQGLKELVQAEAMVRSVSDNASINKANAYVGFLNVVGNASEQEAIAEHSENVVKTISGIDTSKMSSYKEPLDELRDNIKNLLKSGDGGKEVFVFSPKFKILKDEFVKLMGFSIYSNTPCRFVINDDEMNAIYSKSLILRGEKTGQIKISFESQNLEQIWLKDEIFIKVIEKEIKRPPC